MIAYRKGNAKGGYSIEHEAAECVFKIGIAFSVGGANAEHNGHRPGQLFYGDQMLMPGIVRLGSGVFG